MPRPRKKIPLELERDLRALAQDGYSPSQILGYLRRKYGGKDVDPELRAAAQSLDLKTVIRRTRELPGDDSEPWTLAGATPEEAAVVLPVLGALLADSAALLEQRPNALNDPRVAELVRGRRLTVGLAKWLVKVATAAPSLPPYEQYLVAREYRAWELQAARPTPRRVPPTDPAALDAFLACRPWESEAAATQYERLLAQGLVKQPRYLGTWWRSILEREQVRRLAARLGRRVERLHRRLQQLQQFQQLPSTEGDRQAPMAAARHEPSGTPWARVVAEAERRAALDAALAADLHALREALTALEPHLQARGQALRHQVEALQATLRGLQTALEVGTPAGAAPEVVEALHTEVVRADTEVARADLECLVVTAWGQLLQDVLRDVRRALARDLPPHPTHVPPPGGPPDGSDGSDGPAAAGPAGPDGPEEALRPRKEEDHGRTTG